MHRTLVRLAFVTALATGGVMAFAGGAPAVDAEQTATFECTGDTQSWVVPANVTSATFDVLGAAGGVGDDGSLDRASAPAGLGGQTTATISVTPGETIEINVGCAGSDSLGNSAPGGFGGSPGGDGGIGGDLGTGGGGGGSSDVRQGGTALTNRAVVAGGGGGSGGANGIQTGSVNATATEVGGGGDGGGLAGDDGVDTDNAGGGGGGTQAANGAGGSIADCESSGVEGDDGTDGAGGDGGSEPTFGAGGGGGGGYGSGGGGAGCVNGGGGGGGAGFAIETASGVVHEVGVQEGDGRVVVTFTPGTPAPTPAPAVAARPAFTG